MNLWRRLAPAIAVIFIMASLIVGGLFNLLKTHHDQDQLDKERQQQKKRSEQQYQCGLAYPRSIRCGEDDL